MSKLITMMHQDEINKIRELLDFIYGLCNEMEVTAKEIEDMLDNAQSVKAPE